MVPRHAWLELICNVERELFHRAAKVSNRRSGLPTISNGIVHSATQIACGSVINVIESSFPLIFVYLLAVGGSVFGIMFGYLFSISSIIFGIIFGFLFMVNSSIFEIVYSPLLTMGSIIFGNVAKSTQTVGLVFTIWMTIG